MSIRIHWKLVFGFKDVLGSASLGGWGRCVREVFVGVFRIVGEDVHLRKAVCLRRFWPSRLQPSSLIFE